MTTKHKPAGRLIKYEAGSYLYRGWRVWKLTGKRFNTGRTCWRTEFDNYGFMGPTLASCLERIDLRLPEVE